MRCSLLIGGGDHHYMKKLTSYLLASSKNSYEITYVGTIKSLMGLENKAFHVVMLDESFYKVYSNHCLPTNDNLIIKLVDGLGDRLDSINDLQEEHYLFKYQKVSVIEKTIEDLFLTSTDLEIFEHQKKQCIIIGCFSPIGGAGTSTVASMLARINRGIGKEVLHLSTEYFPIYDRQYQTVQSYNLSDYLTYLLTRDNWMVGLKRMVSEDELTGIHYFRPQVHMQDMIDFEGDLLLKFMNYLKEYSPYDVVVIDLPCHRIHRTLECLNQCDEVVYVVRQDAIGEGKWRRFKEDMAQSLKRLESEKLLDTAESVLPGQSVVAVVNPTTETSYNPKEHYDLQLNYEKNLASGNDYGARGMTSLQSYKILEAYFNERL